MGVTPAVALLIAGPVIVVALQIAEGRAARRRGNGNNPPNVDRALRLGYLLAAACWGVAFLLIFLGPQSSGGGSDDTGECVDLGQRVETC